MANRQVTLRRAAMVYNGRNYDYDARFKVEAGTTFPYSESYDGWLRVHLNGLSGWVDGSACRLSDPDADPAPEFTAQPDHWAMAFPGVSLSVRFEGTEAFFELAGALPDDLLADPGDDGQSIVIRGTGLLPAATWLDINTRACVRLEAEEDVARLLLDRSTSWDIDEHTSSLLRLRLEALAVAVTTEPRKNREVVHVSVDGYTRPATEAMSGGLLLDLPGVNATRDFPATFKTSRSSGKILADAGDLTLSLKTRASYPYLLRQDGNDVSVELLDKGLKGKLIVLDPGHDATFDVGATGRGGTREPAVNYDIASRLAELLRKDGAQVLLTHSKGQTCVPRDEIDAIPYYAERIERELQGRVDVANDAGADLFLSIHNNANNDASASGTQTYYAQANLNAERSAALGKLIQSELVSALDSRDWGLLTEQFYVVKYTHCPAVLAEVLFLSNADDEAALNDPDVLQAAAVALRRAIRRYYGVKAGTGQPTPADPAEPPAPDPSPKPEPPAP